MDQVAKRVSKLLNGLRKLVTSTDYAEGIKTNGGILNPSLHLAQNVQKWNRTRLSDFREWQPVH